MSSDQVKEIKEASVLSDEELEDVGGGYDGAVITGSDTVFRGGTVSMSNALLTDDDDNEITTSPFNALTKGHGLFGRRFRIRKKISLKQNRNPLDFFSGGGGGGMTQG